MEIFDSTKRSLFEILKDVHSGKIQLPDFQRGWIWDDNRIKGILASVAKSFPIGAVMLLETGNENVKFKTKPVEGVKLDNEVNPDLLILDGQQRITSLYQTIITNEIVTTRNEKNYKIKRWYYIDMVKAMDDNYDLEEAIISINEKKKITEDFGRRIVLDLSEKELEYKNLMYPVCMIDNYSEWRREFNEYWRYDREKSICWDNFEDRIVNSFNKYMLPVIILNKENPKEAVCQVFEKVNTGGVSLTVFELLTATFAADEFDLKQDWQKIKEEFKNYKLLSNVSNTDIIQAITLLATYNRKLSLARQNIPDEELPAVSCKRKDMLNLSLQDYQKYRDPIVRGFIKASKILLENHIFSARDLPYDTQLIPMSAFLAVLGNNIDNLGRKKKLMQWFWCGVFGELYGSANETRYALDLPQVVNWIENNGHQPKTIYDANFSPSRLHTLRTRNSAAYKGVYALLMGDETKDWLSATKMDVSTYLSESIDIHHIFPVKWCEKNGICKDDYNCIINKTPLSSRTNRIVSGDAPSKYLVRLQKRAEVEDDEFQNILNSHVLSPEFLYNDDFIGFFNDRKKKILQRIEKAMNKTIPRGESQEEGVYVDED
ncbi:MAG: GmrSD restriction endonuclease domain-containing protein [Syntrophaceticus sp.]